jgi:hypothetical protein
VIERNSRSSATSLSLVCCTPRPFASKHQNTNTAASNGRVAEHHFACLPTRGLHMSQHNLLLHEWIRRSRCLKHAGIAMRLACAIPDSLVLVCRLFRGHASWHSLYAGRPDPPIQAPAFRRAHSSSQQENTNVKANSRLLLAAAPSFSLAEPGQARASSSSKLSRQPSASIPIAMSFCRCGAHGSASRAGRGHNHPQLERAAVDTRPNKW